MRRLIPLIVVLVAASSFLALRPATTTDAGDLEGVWKTVHFTTADGEENEVTTPNLTIFTATHYASLRAGQREQLPDDPTDEQRVAAWIGFFGNAGTYEVDGNEMCTKIIIAKSPNLTAEQAVRCSTFEVDGDTLIRTLGNGLVLRYTRIE